MVKLTQALYYWLFTNDPKLALYKFLQVQSSQKKFITLISLYTLLYTLITCLKAFNYLIMAFKLMYITTLIFSQWREGEGVLLTRGEGGACELYGGWRQNEGVSADFTLTQPIWH